MQPYGYGKEYEMGVQESQYVAMEIRRAAYDVFGKDSCRVFAERDVIAPGNINTSMIKNIIEADYVVADITGENPNVYLELGIIFATREHGTILIYRGAQPKLPFDIHHYRYCQYSYFPFEKNSLRKKIRATLNSMSDDKDTKNQGIHSPVFEAVRTTGIARGPELLGVGERIHFRDLTHASGHIADAIVRRAKRGENVDINYIGMTMENAWDPIKSALRAVIAEFRNEQIKMPK